MNPTETTFSKLTTPTIHTRRKHEVLFHQGDSIEYMYVIRQGRVKLMRSTLDGNTVILQMALAGELLAEASLFAERYHCQAVVESATVELARFPKAAVLNACQQSTTVAMQLAELFSHRIRQLRAIMEIRNIRAAKPRVLAYLQFKADAEHRVNLSMTYKDMAYQVGLAHETFYRMLKQLEVEQRLEKHPQFLRIRPTPYD